MKALCRHVKQNKSQGEGGWGGDGVGNFCPTQAHAACDTLLMLCSDLFPVTFWAGLDAMLRISSCNLSKVARLEDVVRLQESWHVARCLNRFTTWSTIDRVIIFGVKGAGGTGWETFVRHRHMQLVTRSWCSALNFFQSLFEPVLTLCSEFSLVTRQRWHI